MRFKLTISVIRLLPIGLIGVWFAQPSQAEEIPKWEFGLGVGGVSVPHYRGSDQRKEYAAPVPYIRYSGERLKVDREGGRFFFYEGDVMKVDASASFSFPVDSDENRARQGMPDLDPILELGPRVQFYLYESDDRAFRVRAALPVRMAIATDLSNAANAGWVFSPYLQLRYSSSWNASLSVGPIWATEKYHDYFYQVDPEFATATRPAYDASGGYSGSRITLTSSKRFNNIWVGFFARYDSLNGAVFENSPLVKRNDSLMVGVAISYIFMRSKQMVEID